MNPTITLSQSRILVDTNVLLRLRQPGHAHRPIALAALQRLRERRCEVCIVPQVVYEYWAVCTRPSSERDGLSLSVADVARDVAELKRLFEFLDNEAGIYQHWEQVVVAAQVKGKLTHTPGLPRRCTGTAFEIF